VTELIQLGDLFDVRKHVQFSSIKWANEHFFTPIERQKINTVVIAGNHDCTFKNRNDLNSVSLLCPPNVKVIDTEPCTILIGDKSFDMFPWISPSNIELSSELISRSKSDYAVGHFEFANFPMHLGTVSMHGDDHTKFSKYTKVFSGHYHTISSKENILYTGTPCELSWSDCGDPKGFWILDTETGSLEHIRNPYTLYERISYTSGMEYDFESVRGKYVKITVIDKKSQKEFDQFIANIAFNSPLDYRVIEVSASEIVADALDVTNLASTQNMISDVVDSLDISLDKVKLKHSVLELYSEAMELSKN
jgi:DNA repair exonuclease SbcCD nuclease subunit